MDKRLTEARDALLQARRIVVFTGAGVSAESGIPTYRGENGVWRNYRAEDLATLDAFARNPELVWEWYNERRTLMLACSPNAAHLALSEFQASGAREVSPITQNIDNLHRRAGSRDVLELHGNAFRTKCASCDYAVYDHEPQGDGCRGLRDDFRCPRCGSWLRPDVVWFGEPLDDAVLDAAFERAADCDAFLSVGSSLLVQPAALLPEAAHRAGALVIEVNLEPTWLSELARWSFRGAAGANLPKLLGIAEGADRQGPEPASSGDG